MTCETSHMAKPKPMRAQNRRALAGRRFDIDEKRDGCAQKN